MNAYYIPLFVLSTLTYLENTNRLEKVIKNKLFYSLLALLFIIFIGLRSEVGCDWQRYKEMFDKFASMNFFDLLKFNYVEGPHRSNNSHILQEMGHVIITSLAGNIYILNLIYSIIFVLPLFYYCSKIKRVYLSLLISYPYYIVVIGMGPIRQAACISILMISIILIDTKKYFFHLFTTIFSLLIHQFSILFNLLLVVPLFPKIIKNKFSKINIFLGFILVSLILYC